MFKKIVFGFVALLVVVFAGSAIWMSIPFGYQQQLTSKVLAGPNVEQNDQGWLVFTPTEPNGQGVVFYPGGKTDPQTFAPVMKALSEQGYLTVIVSMPLNTAFLGIDKAGEVMAAYSEINKWHLIGHSLGGVAAAEFAAKYPDKLSSLVFWASYPASDVSALTIPTLGLSAAMDDMSTPTKIELARNKYPRTTRFVVIDDANHWQYGYFDPAYSDQEGLLSQEQQVLQVLSHTQLFLASL